ncbi:MAG: DUF4760 domain-containing protein [Bacteroidota bacterium]|jgi:hypothetical protein
MNCESIWISLTALASWTLVFVTWYLVRRQLQMARDDMKVRLQTTYEEKFDSPALIAERKRLAEQLLSNAPHADMQEVVMNFFESVGMLLRRGYFDLDMAWSAFSFYAVRWWSATKDYIAEERRVENNDTTIFEEFENLVDAMYRFEIEKRHLTRAQLEPSKQDLERFLETEKNL